MKDFIIIKEKENEKSWTKHLSCLPENADERKLVTLIKDFKQERYNTHVPPARRH